MAEVITSDKPLTADLILDELSADNEIESKSDEETIDLSKKAIEEDDKDDKSLDKEDEEVVEDEKIEIKDEDEEHYEDVPKRQAILKEFPELFKKFPAIEKAIYREQQYAEVFPTISDAKEASARLGDFKAFEGELLNGNLENILKSVKGTNDKAFGKITSQFLQTLEKVDEKAYYSTLNHIIKNSIITAFNSGKQGNDEQLEIAAQLMHKFIYGTTTITAPDKIEQAKQEDPREAELQNRERSFIQTQLHNAVNDVTTRTDNVIQTTVDKYIDTKQIMTSYVRSKAVEDVMIQVRNSISNDSRFRSLLDKMWEASARDNFSDTSKAKIRNALISKAKTILPGIIQSVKASALKGHATRTREASESKDEKPINSGRPASASKSSSGLGKDGKIPHGVKTLDFLMQD